MFTRIRLTILVLSGMIAGAATVHASCQQNEGFIVRADGKAVVVKALNHYGAAKKNAKFEQKNLKLVKDVVYVLDGRIVPRSMALKPGRRFYAQGSNKGNFFVAALSEANTEVVGMVKAVNGDRLTLSIAHSTDTEELTIPIAGDAVGREHLKPGAKIRVLYPRPLTVDVLTAEAGKGLVAASVPKAAAGILIKVSEDKKSFTLATPAATGWTEFSETGKRPAATQINCRFVGGHSSAGYDLGNRICFIGYWKRPRKMDRFALVFPADSGRTEGVVKELKSGSLVLLQPDKSVKNVSIAGAQVLIDGKPGKAADIAAGSHAFVFAPRKQTFLPLKP